MKHLFSCGKPEHADPEYVYCRCYWDESERLRAEVAALREDPRLQLPLDGPGSHRVDLAELRATSRALADAHDRIRKADLALEHHDIKGARLFLAVGGCTCKDYPHNTCLEHP